MAVQIASGTTEHHKIRFVTANYAQLQGLRMVPLGVFLLLWISLDLMGFLDARQFAPSDRARILTRIGFAYWAALLLALAAPAYYRFRYGSVDSLDRGRRNRWITAVVIGVFVLVRADATLDWPVSLSLLLVAASLFVTALAERWVRPYYLLAAALWLMAGCLPALGGPPTNTKLALVGLGGLTLIIIGIGDHLFLTRTLALPKHLNDAPDTTNI